MPDGVRAADPAGPERRATVLDVAALAEVSRQTVSNALNHPERVAAPTLDRVLVAVSALGFTPHHAATSLRRRRPNAIAFQVEHHSDRTFGSLADPFLTSLAEAAQARGAHVVSFVADAEATFATYERLLGSQAVDGFVLSSTRHQDPRPRWLAQRGVPWAAFGRIWDEPTLTSWVDVDGRAGVRAAVAHLAGAGYRRAAWLGWPEGSAVGDDRRDGWRTGCTDSGVVPGPEASSVQDALAAASAARDLLGELSPGDAVVCASDVLALGVVLAARERALAVGRDLGVVGFDDGDVAAVFGITTVRQPLETVAGELMRVLDGGGTGPGVLLAPELIVRSSTQRRPPIDIDQPAYPMARPGPGGEKEDMK